MHNQNPSQLPLNVRRSSTILDQNSLDQAPQIVSLPSKLEILSRKYHLDAPLLQTLNSLLQNNLISARSSMIENIKVISQNRLIFYAHLYLFILYDEKQNRIPLYSSSIQNQPDNFLAFSNNQGKTSSNQHSSYPREICYIKSNSNQSHNNQNRVSWKFPAYPLKFRQFHLAMYTIANTEENDQTFQSKQNGSQQNFKFLQSFLQFYRKKIREQEDIDNDLRSTGIARKSPRINNSTQRQSKVLEKLPNISQQVPHFSKRIWQEIRQQVLEQCFDVSFQVGKISLIQFIVDFQSHLMKVTPSNCKNLYIKQCYNSLWRYSRCQFIAQAVHNIDQRQLEEMKKIQRKRKKEAQYVNMEQVQQYPPLHKDPLICKLYQHYKKIINNSQSFCQYLRDDYIINSNPKRKANIEDKCHSGVSDTRNNLSRGLTKQSTKFREKKKLFDY